MKNKNSLIIKNYKNYFLCFMGNHQSSYFIRDIYHYFCKMIETDYTTHFPTITCVKTIKTFL